MKSLKAKFRKADVSAAPKDMGTCPGLPVPRGVSGFHRGLGTQDVLCFAWVWGHGDLSRVANNHGCHWDYRWEQGRAKEGKAAPRRGECVPGPVPISVQWDAGMAASFPAATARLGSHLGASKSMLLNYSAPDWHNAAYSYCFPGWEEGDSAVPTAYGSTRGTCRWRSLHYLLCSECSVPQFPYTAVRGEG